MKKTLLILLAAAFTGTATAQRLYFPQGDVEWSEVTLSGTNLQVKVVNPNGSVTLRAVPAANVVRVDWPYPEELSDALSLILKLKFDEALAKASAVRTIHANWKDKPGSWFVPASLFAAECHIRKGNAAEADKILTELRNMTLSSNYQKGLLMVQAHDSRADARA